MPTSISTSNALAVKAFSVALFNESIRKGTFRRNLTGPAPKQTAAEAKAKGQTSPGMPFVTITDLSSGPGDTVSIDLFNIVSGKPVMGDQKLAGRMMSLASSSMDMKINQCRGGVDTGGRMSQKRTRHSLRGIAKANLAGWNARLYDQLAMVHCAGARGTQNDNEWIVPPTTDADFTSIVVNSVLAPTRNRRFFAGDATSVTNLDTADILTLNDLDRIRMTLGELPFTMQPIQMEGDNQAEDDPLYVLYVTEAVWYNLQISTTGQNWRSFLAGAHERSKGFDHPLFRGSPGLWANFLVKKMKRAIRYAAADTVVEYDASNAAANVTANVGFDRCLLMGAQALATAYGNAEGGGNDNGYYFKWHEELTDHENIREISSSSISGMAKIRFTGTDGSPTDQGVATIDCYAPTT
jgi:N4-gp56 family major capsid protein